MSVAESVIAVPRQAVRLGFASARLPLSLAERLAERQGIDLTKLPPVAAYDAVEAQIKIQLGRILGDEALAEEGLRQEAAIRQRKSAEWLEGQAEEVRQSADAALQNRAESAEKTRDRVNQETEQRRAELERQEQKAKAEAAEKARKREEAARRAARTRQKAVEARERQAELARIKAENEALDKQAQALQAEQVVSAIDGHLEGRKNGR